MRAWHGMVPVHTASAAQIAAMAVMVSNRPAIPEFFQKWRTNANNNQHSKANGRNPRNPKTGISKSFQDSKWGTV